MAKRAPKAPPPTSKRKPPVIRTGSPGRPTLDLDVAQIEELARIDCTMIEIAAAMGCSVDTLENNYSDTIEKGRRDCHRSIRRMQYKSASEGNVTMQIWLGKVQLGQRETTVTEHTGKDGGPIEILTPEQKAARVQELLTTGLTRKPTPDAVN